VSHAVSQMLRPSNGELTVDGPIPLYYQIREVLLAEITNGKYRYGERFPTERDLVERFGVSRITVRQALTDLESAGILDRRAGRGTFLRQPRIEQELDGLTGFVEDMRALGLEPSARVVDIRPGQADQIVAEKLNLAVGAPIVRIERLRLANQQPVSLDVTFLPEEIGARVAQENLVVVPIFDLLENMYGIALREAIYRIEASIADSHVAKLLEIHPRSPILQIERTSFSISGNPVDYEILHYRGDKITYRMRLERRR
jgi:GntR family transcriptional regulator